MPLDIDIIKQNYRNLPDAKLQRVTDDLKKLRPEVIPFLLEELQKRGLEEAIKVENYISPPKKKIGPMDCPKSSSVKL